MASAGEAQPGNAGNENAGGVEQPPAAPATTGSMLAAARTAAGLDLAEIASTTRVPLRHLKALEADNHDGLPALPYAQGFVRAFAGSVGLDPEEMAARFRAETSKQPHVPSQIAMAALDERRLPRPGLVMASLVALVLVIGLLSAWGAGAFDPEPEAVVVAEVEPMAPEPPAAPAADGPAAAAGAAMPAVAADAPVVLTAKAEVWMRVFDPATGTVAFSGILTQGQRFEVPTAPPGLRLWTGRAGALAVTLGGRELPPLGGEAEVLKNVSLAPADLLARSAPPALPNALPPSLPAAAPPAVPAPAGPAA